MLAFPEPSIGPLAWIAIAPLLAIAARTGVRRGAGLGFIFGFAFFGLLLHWISIVGYLAWLVLVLLQAGFLALFGALWAGLSQARSPAARVALAAGAWVAVEFLRSLVPVGGFTWGELAQGQTELRWLLRAASLGGGWLVAGIVVAINALVVESLRYLRAAQRRPALAGVTAAALLLVAPLTLPANLATGESVRAAIVQGNVPRDFSGSPLDKELAIIASHEHLTEELAPLRPDLVIWPESSVGLDITTSEDAARAVREAARAVDAPMIVGANLDAGEDRYKVVAFHVDASGEVVDTYQKTHLVPFGEYVPARAIFGWIPALEQVPRDAVAARDPRVFDVAGGRVAPVISFEGDFGSLVRRPIAEGGRILVVATNASTWDDSWASAQHLAFSQVRAAENGVWVAHAALSGISAFVAPDGTIVDATPLWTATALVDEVRFAETITLYARLGDWFPWLCAAATLAGLVLVRRTHSSRESSSERESSPRELGSLR